jgi:hypothetical protein
MTRIVALTLVALCFTLGALGFALLAVGRWRAHTDWTRDKNGSQPPGQSASALRTTSAEDPRLRQSPRDTNNHEKYGQYRTDETAPAHDVHIALF